MRNPINYRKRLRFDVVFQVTARWHKRPPVLDNPPEIGCLSLNIVMKFAQVYERISASMAHRIFFIEIGSCFFAEFPILNEWRHKCHLESNWVFGVVSQGRLWAAAASSAACGWVPIGCTCTRWASSTPPTWWPCSQPTSRRFTCYRGSSFTTSSSVFA